MSAPSIAPFLPFSRVRVVGQRVQADPATATFELAPDRRFTPRCSRCGTRAPRVHSRYRRRVRDLALGEHQVWLDVPVRKLRCPECERIRSEAFEFVDRWARVTCRMARYVAELCRILSVAVVARHLVLDYETGRVVWMGEGRRKETLASFLELKSPEERAAVEAVAMDMWAPYIGAVREWLPNARVVYDLYHVVANYHHRVLDKVRIAAYKRAESEQERRWIKGSRYLLYKNEENLTGGQRPRLEKLLEVNQAIHTAYLLRDSLKEIRTLRSPWAVRRALGEWCEMAEQSGIGPLKRFATSLGSHRRGIVAHAAYPIHTGRLEGVNNKIKLIKRRSYGFRDPTYFTLKVKQAFPGK